MSSASSSTFLGELPRPSLLELGRGDVKRLRLEFAGIPETRGWGLGGWVGVGGRHHHPCPGLLTGVPGIMLRGSAPSTTLHLIQSVPMASHCTAHGTQRLPAACKARRALAPAHLLDLSLPFSQVTLWPRWPQPKAFSGNSSSLRTLSRAQSLPPRLWLQCPILGPAEPTPCPLLLCHSTWFVFFRELRATWKDLGRVLVSLCAAWSH